MLKPVCGSSYSENTRTDEYSEIDLCKNISVCLVCENREKEIIELLVHLKRNQTPSGRWTNTGRTAHVLVFLLNNLSKLKSISNTDISIDDMIYNGILHLRSEYNWKNANWDNDIQATAKAIHAIGLYNKQYKYSTQDFFKTLEIESDKIYSATVIHNVSESMRKLRQQSNEMIVQVEKLTEGNRLNQNLIEEQKERIEANDQYENEIAKQIIKTRTIATICGTLFVAFVFYLTFRYPLRVAQEFRQIDITGIILGFIVGLVLTNIAQRTVGKSELLKKIKDKKKGKRKKK
jgi:Fe2+ transport system protein B